MKNYNQMSQVFTQTFNWLIGNLPHVEIKVIRTRQNVLQQQINYQYINHCRTAEYC